MNKPFRIFFFSFFLFACNNNDDKPAEQKPVKLQPQYFYFPRANVYFDSANKAYVFLANDSTGWQMAKQIPNVMQGLMDKSAYIQNPPEPVWTDNEKHKLIYSALLYATAQDTVMKKVVPKPVAPPPVADTLAKERKRKGIKKLVDKIFGIFKKNKKKKDTVQ